jgi:hypothetical protein
MVRNAQKYKKYIIGLYGVDGNVGVTISAWSFSIGWRWIKFYDKSGKTMHAIRSKACYSVCLFAALKSPSNPPEQDHRRSQS